ncbi:L,D-transpeptidase [Roseovarius indicus]|uniref:Peptidase n=1 Tax=Roseovarius indicus TaxID=540747 RepID=A0A0T5P139_9RHOB|nr:L,D-transpeptidase [Roseovarius indicus]KRS14872.1 peptidase [Roseovarius indicus]QEW29997.1 putative L,D-transpeptidase ErfK/SrfK precursor [Roseovarius indicus]SFE71324.1 L,D-transpeptidase catalytic domain [Roseovarius indicus]
MEDKTPRAIRRRGFLFFSVGGLVALAAPSVLRAQESDSVRRNISSFRLHRWQDHFDALGKGILLSDTNTRVLQHWTADGEMRIYPTSVPKSDELTRRGYSEIVYKDEAPDWVPTPSMRERDPSLPDYVAPGPKNPLGVRAMHLTWQYYRIHGTGDTRKIGRRSSSGCIGLYNEHIIEVFDRTPIGTQVKLI